MPALQLRPRCKRTQPELDLVPPTHLQVLFYSQELVTLPAGTLPTDPQVSHKRWALHNASVELKAVQAALVFGGAPPLRAENWS